jgi:putative component of toxin-antitoxin plasmid stabilization module
MEIRYYETAQGRSPFAEWFEELDPVTRVRVAAAITRMEQGNLSRTKSVGEGVLEYKMDFGPGAVGDPAHRRNEKAATARYQRRH